MGQPSSSLNMLKQVKLRYDEKGHLRFDLPPELCLNTALAQIEAGLKEVPGIYRITFFPRLKKLSIRYDTVICSRTQVINALIQAIGQKVKEDATPVSKPSLKERFLNLAPVQKARAQYQNQYQKLKSMGIIASEVIALKSGLPQPLPFDPKEWAVHFINDLVAFYLVRTHWERIITQWLPQPWRHRYQWLTVLYLTFLLVRYRKKINK